MDKTTKGTGKRAAQSPVRSGRAARLRRSLTQASSAGGPSVADHFVVGTPIADPFVAEPLDAGASATNASATDASATNASVADASVAEPSTASSFPAEVPVAPKYLKYKEFWQGKHPPSISEEEMSAAYNRANSRYYKREKLGDKPDGHALDMRKKGRTFVEAMTEILYGWCKADADHQISKKQWQECDRVLLKTCELRLKGSFLALATENPAQLAPLLGNYNPTKSYSSQFIFFYEPSPKDESIQENQSTQGDQSAQGNQSAQEDQGTQEDRSAEENQNTPATGGTPTGAADEE